MLYGIVADVHGNLAAFEAVLADMGEVAGLWCLGDLVGYGPNPNECIDLLRRHDFRCVRGNHDMAAMGKIDVSEFNHEAAAAANWTARALSESSRLFLASLPERVVVELFTLVHGSPRMPVWEYLTYEARAASSFPFFETQGCLVGHTHVPALYVQEPNGKVVGTVPEIGQPVELGERRLIANPGGVGQPRDEDPRAAYALYDAEKKTLEWRRVAYPIKTTQDLMRQQGLPRRLIDRLTHGW